LPFRVSLCSLKPSQCYTQGCNRGPAAIHKQAAWRASTPSGGAPSHSTKRSAKSFIRINDRIRAREIRVIDENGEQLGILAPFEALKIAANADWTWSRFHPTRSRPSAAYRITGRYLYEKEKSERAARKKQKVITVKEVKFSVTVDEHDYQTKKNQAVRFLTEGDKSRPACASAAARWRTATGLRDHQRLIQDIGEAGIVEFMPRMEGTILHAILAPSKKQEQPKPNCPRLRSSPAHRVQRLSPSYL